MFENIKMIITDVDAVLTDGGMYYNADGLAFKKFHTRDASAIHRLRKAGIIVCAITSANDIITRKRIGDMHFDDSIFNCEDKVKAVQALSNAYHIPLESIAYIGDDYIDLEAMKVVGLAIVPTGSLGSIFDYADLAIPCSAGNGVLACLVDMILSEVKDE